MEDWKEYNLGELIELKNGVAFKSSEFVDHGVPVIKIKNVKPNRILVDDLSYVSQETSLNKRCFDILPTDILITMTGNRKDGGADSWVGKVALFNQTGRYLLNQRVSAIRVKDNRLVDNVYLSYLLSSWNAQLYFVNHSNSSGGQANISPDVVYNYPVALPPLSLQLEIASILKSIDDKIDCNRRINENLEQQAQALFKSWFVDFEPFKDQPFVESELGMIPQGWRVELLGNIIDIKYGKDHKKLLDGDFPVYGSGGLMRYVEKALYSGESVLIPRKGSLNNVMYVDEAFWTVDTMFYSIPKIANVMLYVYIFLCNRDLSSMNAGSAVPSMTTEILNNMKLVFPSSIFLEKYNSAASSLFIKIKKNDIESRRLAELRDTLLPRLMSGELKVNEIENNEI